MPHVALLVMADTRADLLQKAWAEAPHGNLSASAQAKAWALREVWQDLLDLGGDRLAK